VLADRLRPIALNFDIEIWSISRTTSTVAQIVASFGQDVEVELDLVLCLRQCGVFASAGPPAGGVLLAGE
jgi:hypothetical protein